MTKTLLLMTCVVGLAASAPAVAGGDAAAGQTKAMACGGCHGLDGNSPSPVNPKLAGQHEQALFDAMLAYKAGKRDHPTMLAFLQPFSEADIADMAAYYASQPCK